MSAKVARKFFRPLEGKTDLKFLVIDHDDFIKSRRSLIGYSVLLLALANLQIDGDKISVSSIQFTIEQDKLILFNGTIVVYLLYIFLVRAKTQLWKSSFGAERDALETIRGELLTIANDRYGDLSAYGDILVPAIEKLEENISGVDEAIRYFKDEGISEADLVSRADNGDSPLVLLSQAVNAWRSDTIRVRESIKTLGFFYQRGLDANIRKIINEQSLSLRLGIVLTDIAPPPLVAIISLLLSGYFPAVIELI